MSIEDFKKENNEEVLDMKSMMEIQNKYEEKNDSSINEETKKIIEENIKELNIPISDDNRPNVSELLDESKNNNSKDNKNTETKNEEEDIFKEEVDEIKNKIREKVTKDLNIYDLSSFTINNNSTETINKYISYVEVPTVKHIVGTTVYEVELFNGIDVMKMMEIQSNASASEDEIMISLLRLFYSKIVNEDKPSNFNDWLKYITVTDIQDIFAAIYKATVNTSDYIPYHCEDEICKKMSLIDIDGKFEDNYMEFKSEKSKEEYLKIYDGSSTIKTSNSKIVQWTNDLAIEIKPRSVFNAFIIPKLMNAGDNSKILKKYSTIVEYVGFIENIYKIDPENKTLSKIEIENGKNNGTVNGEVAAYKSKLAHIDKLLKTRTNMESELFQFIINENATEFDKKSYVYVSPNIKCPECGHEHKSNREDNMLALVLQKQQLIIQISSLTI